MRASMALTLPPTLRANYLDAARDSDSALIILMGFKKECPTWALTSRSEAFGQFATKEEGFGFRPLSPKSGKLSGRVES